MLFDQIEELATQVPTQVVLGNHEEVNSGPKAARMLRSRPEQSQPHDMFRYGRLRWLGHIADQEDTRLPKRVVHSRLQSNASRGRPPKCWTDYVREDFEAPRLLLDWSSLAKNSDTWRYQIQQLLGHTQQNTGTL